MFSEFLTLFNKHIMNRLPIFCVACLLAAPSVTLAQGKGAPALAAKTIKVENLKVEKADGMLVVDMDLNMDSLHLPSNMRLVFTPLVKDKAQERLLPQILVSGRKSDISYRRHGHKDYAADVVAVRRENHTAQTVHYSAVLPYENWMKNSDVEVAEDLCGCNKLMDQERVTLKKFRKPLMPYLKPKAEAAKERKEEGKAFIDFPVDRVELHPDYRKNPTELRKIIETINLVKQDPNTTITHISIHGYASPESPYSHNAYLAAHRAKTLTAYVRNLVDLPDGVFSSGFTPEDWQGLRTYVERSNLEHKQEILALVSDTQLDPDVREARIKQAYPEQYRFMLATWYPALRHSDYVVTYKVKPFSIEEAKRVLKTKPRQLSLEEMFMVAQTYEAGSPEFNEVMETAVRLYPQDETANLNAACARMETGDLAGAKRYLQRAGHGAEALHARGVMAMLEDQTGEARQLLRQAQEAGDSRAAANLDLLDL